MESQLNCPYRGWSWGSMNIRVCIKNGMSCPDVTPVFPAGCPRIKEKLRNIGDANAKIGLEGFSVRDFNKDG